VKACIIGENDLKDYLDTIELSGITIGHRKEVERFLDNYLTYMNGDTDKAKSLSYFKILKDDCSIAYYKKQMYQILKFLTYVKVEWAKDIELPSDPIYIPKRMNKDMVEQTLSYFKEHRVFKQVKAFVLLGISSGLRAEEIYQLNPQDVDIDNRTIHINHDPSNGQTTKTQRSRISFFNEEAQEAMVEYLAFFNNGSHLDRLFSQTHMTHLFRGAPIKAKELRKYFSQEWDRRGGPTSIKKILMGHSLKGDVDLMHYNYQSEEDLKAIYDKVMGKSGLVSNFGVNAMGSEKV
jgi:integrase/recombinase XerD